MNAPAATVVAATAAEVEALRAEVADLRGRVQRLEPKPRPIRPADLVLFAAILDETGGGDVPAFACGEYVDAETAKAWGECLHRLLPHSPVAGYEITRLGEEGHRRWRLRYVGEDCS